MASMDGFCIDRQFSGTDMASSVTKGVVVMVAMIMPIRTAFWDGVEESAGTA